MCILLYVKLLGCYGVSWIYGQLEGDPSAMGICAFCDMWNFLCVMVYHGSIVDWRGFVCHGYIWILLYLKLIGCTGVAEMYSHLDGGVHLTLVYAHSAFTLHLLHISVIVTVLYCYSSLVVHAQLEMNNNSMTH